MNAINERGKRLQRCHICDNEFNMLGIIIGNIKVPQNDGKSLYKFAQNTFAMSWNYILNLFILTRSIFPSL